MRTLKSLKVKPDLYQVSESNREQRKLPAVLKVMTNKQVVHGRELGLQFLVNLLINFLHFSTIDVT